MPGPRLACLRTVDSVAHRESPPSPTVSRYAPAGTANCVSSPTDDVCETETKPLLLPFFSPSLLLLFSKMHRVFLLVVGFLSATAMRTTPWGGDGQSPGDWAHRSAHALCYRSSWCTESGVIPCITDYCAESEILSVASAMVKSGMVEKGLNLVQLDDCWAGERVPLCQEVSPCSSLPV